MNQNNSLPAADRRRILRATLWALLAGVLMVVGVGLVAPPVGLNVYVVNSLARDVPMNETYKGVMPFLAWDLVRMVLLLMFPALSLGLMKLLYG